MSLTMLEIEKDREKEDSKKQLPLKVLNYIQKINNYQLESISCGYARIYLELKNTQTIDNTNIIFEADLFKAANFCALAAVNEEHAFVINANVEFLSQVDTNANSIIFEAKELTSSLGKRFVEVKGLIQDILVFTGDFTVIKFDNRSLIQDKNQQKKEKKEKEK